MFINYGNSNSNTIDIEICHVRRMNSIVSVLYINNEEFQGKLKISKRISKKYETVREEK